MRNPVALFHIASLALWLGAGAMWARSYLVMDVLSREGRSSIQLDSNAGWIEFSDWRWQYFRADLRRFDHGWRLGRVRAGTIVGPLEWFRRCSSAYHMKPVRFLGFWYAKGVFDGGWFPKRYCQIVFVRYWMVFALLGVEPTWWLVFGRRREVRRRRARRGLCAYCAYDLRATPERCPECGSAPYRLRKSITERAGPLVRRTVSAAATCACPLLCLLTVVAYCRSFFCTDAVGFLSEEHVSAKWLDSWSETHAAAVTVDPETTLLRSRRGTIECARVMSTNDSAYKKRLYFAAPEHVPKTSLIYAAAAPLATEPPSGAHTLSSRRCGILGIQWVRARWQQNVPMLDPSVTGESAAPTRLVNQTTSAQSIRISYAWIMLAAAILPCRRLWRRRRTPRRGCPGRGSAGNEEDSPQRGSSVGHS